jgi:diacylglycerol kinase
MSTKNIPPQQRIEPVSYNSASDSASDTVMFGLILAIPIIMLLLNAWFLYYIYELKRRGCNCAIGWRRNFIELYLVLFFLAIVLALVLPTEQAKWVSLTMSILLFVYVVVTRQFIDQMDQTNCTCAQTDAFSWLNVINWIMIVVIIFSFVVSVLALARTSR